MKFPIAFLSLLTTAAYAQHEPKSLRGSVEDVDFLETNDVTVSPDSVATINCGSGDQCCLQQDSHCGTISATGSIMTYGGGPLCLTGGTVSGGGHKNCALSCTGSCNVSVAATGGGGGGGGPPNSGGGGGNPNPSAEQEIIEQVKNETSSTDEIVTTQPDSTDGYGVTNPTTTDDSGSGRKLTSVVASFVFVAAGLGIF